MKAGGVEGVYRGLEWHEKQQRLDQEKEGNDENIKLFGNVKAWWVVIKRFGLHPRGNSDGVDVEGSLVLMAQVDAWMSTLVRWLDEPEMHRGQGKKLFFNIQRDRVELAIAQPIGNQ